jgi:hypothetical protein
MPRLPAVLILLVASTLPATAASQCSQQTLMVEGSPVTIGYCVSGPAHANGVEEVVVPVAATYSAPGGSIHRAIELHFIAGEGVSRVIQSLDLAALGLTGTLHLTLAYSRGLVDVEGALLTPGAITIK